MTWFFDRRKTLDEDGLRRLAHLPIFPTAAGPKGLVGLALPGDFTDELGLAQLVDVEAVPEIVPFLAKLGAKTLDFLPATATDFVPDAISRGDVAEDTRLRLLGVLARKFSEVQDNSLRCVTPSAPSPWCLAVIASGARATRSTLTTACG